MSQGVTHNASQLEGAGGQLRVVAAELRRDVAFPVRAHHRLINVQHHLWMRSRLKMKLRSRQD